MQITIKSVDTEYVKTAKGGYEKLEVVYDNQGKTEVKKLMSFSNPKVYEKIKKATQGETFDVELSKDEKGYWQWASLNAAVPSATPSGNVENKPAATKGSTSWETAEERALKQRLIVRQSCLKTAADFLNGAGLADVPVLLQTADTLVAWVYQAPGLIEMEDDIPY